MLKKYRIEVTQTVGNHELDPDDRIDNPSGVHHFYSDSEEHALDDFHSTIPIACLEDFDIDCMEVAE